MKKLFTLALCFAAMNLIGCASAGLKNVDPSWTEAPSSVTVLFTEPDVQNKDDVVDDLPDFADNFSGWFSKQMGDEFNKQAGMTPKFEVKGMDAFDFVPTTFKKKNASVPQPKFEAIGEVGGFVISIANVVVSRFSETKMTGLTSAETKSYLQFAGEYSIANASEKKVVTTGSFAAREQLGFALTKSNWENLMETLVEEIIKDTPLKKK